MCSFLEWSPEAWTAFFTFLLTVATGGLLWVAYTGFNKIYSQEASKRQMNTMLDLITTIGRDKIEVFDAINTFEFFQGAVHNKSFLEYTETDLNSIDINVNDLYCRINIQSMAYGFIEMPILPSSIAIRLKELRDLPSIDFKFNGVLGTKHFYIIQDILSEDTFVTSTVKKYTQGYTGYIRACLNLKDAVRNWFSKHGVSDLNSDFIPL